MNIKKEKPVLIFSAIITIFFIIILIYLVFYSFKNNDTLPEKETVNQAEESYSPPQTNYDNSSINKLFEIATNERSLSESDISAKQKLTQSDTEFSSGVVYSSNNTEIGYLSGPDIFQAEIKIADITKAKKETIDFLINQGISAEGICKLPLMFILSPQVQEDFSKSGRIFNPLPDNCN